MRLGRPRDKGPQSDLSRLVAADPDSDEVDVGQLVRALARSVVHVPLPEAAHEARPRMAGPDDGDPPLCVVEDEHGRHALVYSTPRALVEVWGGVTAASVPMARLLMGWPDGVDLVIDQGRPRSLVVPLDILGLAALDVGGVPTAASTAPSPAGYDLERPDPELSQLIGVSRTVADDSPEVLALWRAELLNRETSPRPLLVLLVEVRPDAGTADPAGVADRFGRAVNAVEPRPVMVVICRDGHEPSDPELVRRVRELDDPFWRRTTT